MTDYALLWVRRTTIAIVLTGIAACGVAQVAYNNVDTLIRWKADDYFALDGYQERLLKTRLDSALAWHRSEELPRYSEVLTAAAERVSHGISRADVEAFLDHVRTRYDAAARRLAPGAADLLCSLKPDQIAHFESRARRENERFTQEYLELSEEDQRTQRAHRTIEAMEDWMGELTPVQATRIESLSRVIPLTNALRLADRERRQRELVTLTSHCSSKSEATSAVATWMTKWDQGRAPEYARLGREARERTIAMVVELDSMLTPEQRAHAAGRLERLAADFQTLSAGGKGRSNPSASGDPWSSGGLFELAAAPLN